MKPIGIRIKDIETVQTTFKKLEKSSIQELAKNHGKTPSDFLIKYLGSQDLFANIFTKFTHYVHSTLPNEITSSCQFCNGKSDNESDRKCNSYTIEANLNLFFASHHFVSTIILNKHLIYKQEDLKQLTINFFECFLFNKGRVYFNNDKMIMYCLKVGFKTLSQMFDKNEPLNNMSNIITTLDDLNSQFLEFKMFEDEIPVHIEPQIAFFKNKLSVYKTKHFINQEIKKQINFQDNNEEILSKQEKILPKLNQYKFHLLEKVKNLDSNILTSHIFSNHLPYQIAYLHYLGFIDYILKNYCKSQTEMHKILSKILDTDARSIRGNVNGLRNKNSKDRNRYTAHLHTKKVIEHYQSLK